MKLHDLLYRIDGERGDDADDARHSSVQILIDGREIVGVAADAAGSIILTSRGGDDHAQPR
jgi:hypothetical protein